MGPNVRKWLIVQTFAIVVVFVTGLIVISVQNETFNAKNCFQRVVTSLSQNWFSQQQNCHGGIDWTIHQVEKLNMEQIITYVEWSNSSSCRLSHDFGGNVIFTAGMDGQKAVCLDPAVMPERASGAWPPVTKKKFSECLVYSFGIKNEWSFDEAMEALGCRVYAFDPSMNRTRHDHTSKIHFYDLGLSDRDGQRLDREKNWTMKSLDSIYYNLLGHKARIIDYLKIDIERDEWIVLPQILSSGMMDQVRQLGVEIHLLNPEENNRLEDIRKNIKILKSLEDYGLVRFDSKFNPWSNDVKIIDNADWWGYDAYELVWYNSKVVRHSHKME